MKIEYLREFLDLADTLNYSVTANRLYISQPTLSRHIKTMESELGFSLVNTSSHGISLTKSGELAVASFRKMVREYDRFLKQNERLTNEVTGELNIGILYYSMDEFFSSFLEAISEKYPNVSFSIYNYQPHPLYEDLMSGKVDVASLVLYDKDRYKDLRLLQIGEQKSIVMMRSDHPLSAYDGVRLEELVPYELIGLKRDQHSTEETQAMLEKNRIRFRGYLESDNIETVPMTIRKTGGVHLTGENCKRQQASGICYREILGDDTRFKVYLAALPGNDNPLLDRFFQEAESYYKEQQR